jgi:hypothetical protein
MLVAGALIVTAVVMIVRAPAPLREHGRGILRRTGAAEAGATR